MTQPYIDISRYFTIQVKRNDIYGESMYIRTDSTRTRRLRVIDESNIISLLYRITHPPFVTLFTIRTRELRRLNAVMYINIWWLSHSSVPSLASVINALISLKWEPLYGFVILFHDGWLIALFDLCRDLIELWLNHILIYYYFLKRNENHGESKI